MTTEKIKAAIAAKPFRPFRLRLADGAVLPVDHPEFIALSPGGRTVLIFGPGEELEIVDLLLVTSLAFGASSKTRRNGQR